MKPDLAKRVELFANISIIVVALLIVTVITKKYFFDDNSLNPPEDTVNVGSKINLSNIDWGKNNQTLVMVLSKDCHFCKESVPLYQKVSRELSKSQNIKLVAVFPQEMPIAKEYLQANSIVVQDVYQISPMELGVRGTPTLLLVNQKGEVTEKWLGKLNAEQEKQFLERLKSVS
jgi:thiol-disulfide isomerase/thioredoxin